MHPETQGGEEASKRETGKARRRSQGWGRICSREVVPGKDRGVEVTPSPPYL